MMALTDEQVQQLLKPIDKDRVKRDGKGHSHVEIWDVRRTMNQIFGFGNWSADVTEMQLVSEREVQQRNGKMGWNVIYRARCCLRVGDESLFGTSYTEWAAGDATNPTLADAHDQAIKTAESQALKRCAVNLGDQFGLSLYKNGSTEATVGEIVGQQHVDADKVETLMEQFRSCETLDCLTAVAERISGLDISASDLERLRAAYKQHVAQIQEES
jgi:recombination DNA repair RAD52 pathway protein